MILKPSPDEVQHLYLQSLEACGINPRQHDIRFEEDNWESPTLGAWGIGWQVLFDGLEITQFTYFQQVGGIDLSPIACEITYGLERIAMALQRVDNVYDIEWAPGVKYREVRLREEIEQSKYAFGQVDLPREEFAAHHRDLFERHYAFCGVLLRSGLVLARARGVPEVLAPVQHPRCERQRRRDRADRLHPPRAAAGGGDCEGVCGGTDRRCRLQAPGCRLQAVGLRAGPALGPASLEPGACRVLNGPRTPHRTRRRRAARELAAAAHAAAGRGDRRGSSRLQRLAADAQRRGVSARRAASRCAWRASPSGRRDLEELVTGPPVSAATGPDGQPTPAARRLREEERRRGRAISNASRRRRAPTSRSASGSAASPPSTRCRTC